MFIKVCDLITFLFPLTFFWFLLFYCALYGISFACISHFSHITDWKHVMVTLMDEVVPWLRRLAAGLPPRRPGFDLGSVHVGFVVDKVALGQVFLRVLRFSPVNWIIIIIIVIFIIGLHKKPQGCGASVASAAGPFTTKKNNDGQNKAADNGNNIREW
jgi:hypothetical protein